MSNSKRKLLTDLGKDALSVSKDISVNIARTTVTALTELSSQMTSALERSSQNLLEVERRRAMRRDTRRWTQRRTTSRLDIEDNYPDWY